MNKTFLRHYSRVAWLIAFGMSILFIDCISKAYVYNVLPFHIPGCAAYCQGIPVFYNFLGIDFSINFVANKGAAWGMFADFQMALLVIRIVMIIGMFLYLFFINHNRLLEIPLVLIIAGALGNVVDFFLYGFVIDFFRFILWGYHFPIFNFADTCITIGVAWIFFLTFCFKKRVCS